MPLTVELHSGGNFTGHLIIDRNNLIIAVPDKNVNNMEIVTKQRNIIASIFGMISSSNLLTLKSSLLDFKMDKDPKHTALQHMSGYDSHHCQHAHLSFAEDISLEYLQLIFEHPLMAQMESLISAECRTEILTIAKEYFTDLTNSAAEEIEREYRIEKKRELNLAKKENPFESSKQVAEGRVNPLAILVSKQNLFAESTRSALYLLKQRPNFYTEFRMAAPVDKPTPEEMANLVKKFNS